MTAVEQLMERITVELRKIDPAAVVTRLQYDEVQVECTSAHKVQVGRRITELLHVTGMHFEDFVEA